MSEVPLYRATSEREFKIPWREAGPPNHLDDKVDLDQELVNKALSLAGLAEGGGSRREEQRPLGPP